MSETHDTRVAKMRAIAAMEKRNQQQQDMPSVDMIRKVVDMYLFNYRCLPAEEQYKHYYWDYIAEHWND